MTNKHIFKLIILLIISNYSSLFSNSEFLDSIPVEPINSHVFGFFIKDYNSYKSNPKLKSPKIFINRKITDNKLNSKFNTNLFALYNGYLSHTDNNGLVVLPRSSEDTNFTILITKEIKPIITPNGNISYWKIDNQDPANFKAFSISKITKNNKSYWEIKSDESFNPDEPISLDTIIISAKPKNIYIPEQVIKTTDNQQLILPTIYLKKDFSSGSNALSILSVKNYYSQIRKIHQPTKYGFASLPVA